ncbi:hypothetical protein EW146_g2793 [Bondarzewia mesenterica]|uniref:ATP-dependent DNA helicase n=1 Tax=Bondarzewia mesenterica TaxID=1095465 RepID=A0A4S4M149_9AGAM|nr:hypothetical protein EW146_g2793 [Bondarzewia mesenterica]
MTYSEIKTCRTYDNLDNVSTIRIHRSKQTSQHEDDAVEVVEVIDIRTSTQRSRGVWLYRQYYSKSGRETDLFVRSDPAAKDERLRRVRKLKKSHSMSNFLPSLETFAKGTAATAAGLSTIGMLSRVHSCRTFQPRPTSLFLISTSNSRHQMALDSVRLKSYLLLQRPNLHVPGATQIEWDDEQDDEAYDMYGQPSGQSSQKRYDWTKGRMEDDIDHDVPQKCKRDDDGDSEGQGSQSTFFQSCNVTMPRTSSPATIQPHPHSQNAESSSQQHRTRTARLQAAQTCSGRRMLDRLPPWPPQFSALLRQPALARNFVDQCRSINNFFSFAGIAVTGGFTQFPPRSGPPAVTIMGHTYHIVRDAEMPSHSIHWFLYDENAHTAAAGNFGIHATIMQAVHDVLTRFNPYVHSLRATHPSPASPAVRDIELREHTVTGEFAAVLHAANTTTLSPRLIIIRGKRQTTGHILDILTRHYELLHYVLLFPHGDIQWYRSRLFRDDDNRFSTLGRLTYEYLVDMFSRVEEERLAYITRECRHQAHVESARSDSPDDTLDSDLSLPASFLGSCAWASEETADSMALGRSYGKPSFFCTMTFNPNWPEVRSRLTYGQSASDIPFIIARVFKVRLDSVLHILRTCFRKKLYLIKIVEFQRRGFPHAHIVFKISPELPFEQLDMLISAELPVDDPTLREKVLRYNMHPKNHLDRAFSRCNRTTLDSHGHVQWRRRNDADRWVVPYCPALLNFADCHFHFDVIFTSHVFMYLYKYLHKGPDQAHFNIHQPGEQSNEAQDYIKGHYLSAPEAAWRILGYETTRKEPSVTCLPIHLPGENRLQFRRVDTANTSSTSMLNRYFLRPSSLASFRYESYNEEFVLYSYNVRSFEDARTVHGTLHPTFYDAAKALLLIDDRNEGLLAIREAIESLRTPSQLRFLFIHVIVEGYPVLPLWDQFHEALMLDHFDRTQSTSAATDCTLRDLETLLADSGKHLHFYDLPQPSSARSQEVEHELAFFQDRLPVLRLLAHDMYSSLTTDQRHIIDTISAVITHPHPQHTLFFIEGKPGRGKTYMVNALATALRSQSRIVLIIGTSALAATLYDRGRTAHHLFDIPVMENNINLQSKISEYSHRADLIRAASVIIWDELPMANRAAWECVDIAPVIPNGGPTAILHASVKSSALWRSVTIYQLTTPIRTAEDPQYSALIDDIDEDTTHNEVSLAFLRSTTSVDECLNFLYPSHVLPNATLCFNRAFLSPLHTYVDKFNVLALAAHPSDEQLYYSSDALRECDSTDAPELLPDYFTQLKHPAVPAHKLALKVGTICTIECNLAVDKKLVHNARVEVVALRQRSIDVRVIGSDEIHSLPRILFSFNPPYSSWTVNCRQFPLRIAYATTFNSCLGLTLDRIVVDIRTSIFAHGQLYTALSRFRYEHRLQRPLTGACDTSHVTRHNVCTRLNDNIQMYQLTKDAQNEDSHYLNVDSGLRISPGTHKVDLDIWSAMTLSRPSTPKSPSVEALRIRFSLYAAPVCQRAGDNKVNTDLGVVKTGNNANEGEVVVLTAEPTVNAVYEDAIHVLSTKPPKEEHKLGAVTQQEDYYRNFRMNSMNSDAAANGTSKTVDGYMIFILYSVALLACKFHCSLFTLQVGSPLMPSYIVVRFIVSSAYMIIRLFAGE